MSEITVTPAVAETSTVEAAPAPAEAPAAPKGRRVSAAAQRGRAAMASQKAKAAKATATKPAKRGAKVATPAGSKPKTTGPTRQHPFQGTGCLVIVGKVGDPLSGKVVFQSDSPTINDSMAQAIAAGKLTQEQVDSGAAYVAPMRNLWHRV